MKKNWVLTTIILATLTMSPVAYAEETSETTTDSTVETTNTSETETTSIEETPNSSTENDTTTKEEEISDAMLAQNLKEAATKEKPSLASFIEKLTDEQMLTAYDTSKAIGYVDTTRYPKTIGYINITEYTKILEKLYGDNAIPKESYSAELLAMNFQTLKSNLPQVRKSLQDLFDIDKKILATISDAKLTSVIDYAENFAKDAKEFDKTIHASIYAVALVLKDPALSKEVLNPYSDVSSLVINQGMNLKGPKEVQVGEKGTFEITIDYGHDVAFDGNYVFTYDESLITVDQNGNWEALKAGEVNITYGYHPSEKMWNDMVAKSDGGVLSFTETALVHQIKIAEKTVATSTTDTPVAKAKVLPKTGETLDVHMQIMGFIFLVAVVSWGMYCKKAQA